jgi:hypothetical protein
MIRFENEGSLKTRMSKMNCNHYVCVKVLADNIDRKIVDDSSVHKV